MLKSLSQSQGSHNLNYYKELHSRQAQLMQLDKTYQAHISPRATAQLLNAGSVYEQRSRSRDSGQRQSREILSSSQSLKPSSSQQTAQIDCKYGS
jgi:hypothetical protein